jgi:hypothetical protein
MRLRTSSQGSPADSSDSTRRARRSISAAQAASTSAGFSTDSSRLASSSRATSARSSGGVSEFHEVILALDYPWEHWRLRHDSLTRVSFR